MSPEITGHGGTVQWVRALICTIEGLQHVPHVRDGLVLGLARPNAAAPSNIRPCVKKIGRLFPVRGNSLINAPTCTPLQQENLQVLTECMGDHPSLPVDKLPQKGAHGHCQVQNAQDDPGTWQFQNPLRTTASGLQGRRPKEEGRVVGLITLHGLRDTTTLPSLLSGIPYPLIEHGAHLGASRSPFVFTVDPPRGSPLPPPWRPPIRRAPCR